MFAGPETVQRTARRRSVSSKTGHPFRKDDVRLARDRSASFVLGRAAEARRSIATMSRRIVRTSHPLFPRDRYHVRISSHLSGSRFFLPLGGRTRNVPRSNPNDGSLSEGKSLSLSSGSKLRENGMDPWTTTGTRPCGKRVPSFLASPSPFPPRKPSVGKDPIHPARGIDASFEGSDGGRGVGMGRGPREHSPLLRRTIRHRARATSSSSARFFLLFPLSPFVATRVISRDREADPREEDVPAGLVRSCVREAIDLVAPCRVEAIHDSQHSRLNAFVSTRRVLDLQLPLGIQTRWSKGMDPSSSTFLEC